MRVCVGVPATLAGATVGRVCETGVDGVLEVAPLHGDGRGASLALVSAGSELTLGDVPGVSGIPEAEFASLHPGDVVSVSDVGRVHQLWDATASENVIVVTNRCNNLCVMCPQPPSEPMEAGPRENEVMLRTLPLDDTTVILSGGEPTLCWKDFIRLVLAWRDRAVAGRLVVLTNGRAYADADRVRESIDASDGRLTHAVALHADLAEIHDRVTGVPGSFSQTIRGIQNLGRFGQEVEIRVVILHQNFERLPAIAEFIYRNLPFVSHVAWMGAEITGWAWDHVDAVWVEPAEYSGQLRSAVRHLIQRDLRTSIFNLPRCVLPPDLWTYAADSISDWKKEFVTACVPCAERSRCSAFFATSRRRPAGVRAVEAASA